MRQYNKPHLIYKRWFFNCYKLGHYANNFPKLKKSVITQTIVGNNKTKPVTTGTQTKSHISLCNKGGVSLVRSPSMPLGFYLAAVRPAGFYPSCRSILLVAAQ